MALVWWLRVVGVLYLAHFVAMAFARAPIRALGPKDALTRAAAGEPVARFLVDSYVMFGLENLAIGVALLYASRLLAMAHLLAWAVIAIEATRGVAADLYFIARGYPRTPSLIWIAIHGAVIVTGIYALRAG